MHRLSDRMRALAPGHPRGVQLLAAAAKFDAAIDGYFAGPQTVSTEEYMATFQRALSLWSEATREAPA
ncbi:hypothetical protein SAMN05444161_8662 [Rhizobiales bacterium GAS191]|nr:hypothetical protein SAMN05519104_8161 [Rhizobiales bacterium GAS188]SEF11961.1 hypothetical protein SAMN05444161_8662 [Rhizobiales bacterium GAS191]